MSAQRLKVVAPGTGEIDPVREVLAMPEIPTLPDPSSFNPLAAVEEGLAASAMAVGDYRAAIHHCSNLVQVNPEHYQAWLNLGVARMHVGETEDAVFCFHQASRLAYRTAIRVDGRQPVALWNLALLLESGDAREEAEPLLERLVEIDPASDAAWLRLGAARFHRGEWEASAAAFRKCLEIRPASAEATLNLGTVCYALGQWEEAYSRFEQALRASPHSAPALRGLAAVCVETGDSERALPIRKKLVELRQPMPELTYNLACVLDRQERQEEAIRMYCEVLKENPRSAEALLNLGHILDRRNRRPEATECWKRAMALDAALLREYFEARPEGAASAADPVAE
jgi:tetratricopeptide (TPR) repeat protein